MHELVKRIAQLEGELDDAYMEGMRIARVRLLASVHAALQGNPPTVPSDDGWRDALEAIAELARRR